MTEIRCVYLLLLLKCKRHMIFLDNEQRTRDIYSPQTCNTYHESEFIIHYRIDRRTVYAYGLYLHHTHRFIKTKLPMQAWKEMTSCTVQ